MYIFTNVLKLMMVYVFLRYWIYARDYYFSCEKKITYMPVSARRLTNAN